MLKKRNYQIEPCFFLLEFKKRVYKTRFTKLFRLSCPKYWCKTIYLRVYRVNIRDKILPETKKKAGFHQRSRLDIAACILANVNPVSRKTRIIYRCNLSLSQYNRYSECLIQGGLIRKFEQNGAQFYEITEKGKAFMKDYLKIREILDKMRL